MKKFHLKLQTKITLLTIVVILLSLGIATSFMMKWAIKNVQQQVKVNVMNVAEIVANSPTISNALEKKDPNKIIQANIDILLKTVEQVGFIVVADMNGIRYAHPNKDLIGERFVGGDEKRVIEKGQTYISEAIGTLGLSMRAFVPIFDENHIQVGFVSVGTLYKNIEQFKREAIYNITVYAIWGLIIGIIGAISLSDNIKGILLGLEPYQISQLYLEKKGMLEAIHEGILAIDADQRITMINDSAIKIFNIDEEEIIGKKLLDVFPTSKLFKILETGEAEYNREHAMQNTVIMTNRVPIKEGDKIVGAIATFRDMTKITRLAEEITGVKQVIQALRANSHEFMNKLHVILGLIRLGDLEEAMNYIIDVTDRQKQITSMISRKIKDTTVAALILGKLSRAKELGIQLLIDEETFLDKKHGRINSTVLVTVIGNLIENAMEAVNKCDVEVRKVSIRVQEFLDRIEIEIIDNGIGISEEDLPRVLKRGFTTNDKNRGVGLALINEIVENIGGNINIDSKIGEGTRVLLILRKGEKL